MRLGLLERRASSFEHHGSVATGISDDDFVGGSLNTSIWHVVDPVGDCTVTQGSGLLSMAVPGGASHDTWEDGVNGLRVQQNVPDVDFQVEVAFTTMPTSESQSMGLIALDSSGDHLVRFDFHREVTYTSVFGMHMTSLVATAPDDISAGTPTGPLKMRLKRQGNVWSQYYSLDGGSSWLTGISFTFAMTMAHLGLLCGNDTGTPPAFTSTVDYFKKVATASGAHPLRAVFRWGASAANIATLEGPPVNFPRADLVLAHGLRGSWENIESVGFAIADFDSGGVPNRRIAYSCDFLPPGFSFASAASGGADAHWEVQLGKIADDHGQDDAILRVGHEWNLSYVGEWHYTGGSMSDWIGMFRRYVDIARGISGNFLIDWGWLLGGDLNVFDWYPGDAYVDIVSADVYDRKYVADFNARWAFMVAMANGLQAQVDFADAHGKLKGFPEWGVANYVTSPSVNGGDNPIFVGNMHDWIYDNGFYWHTPYYDDNPEVRSDMLDGDFPDAYAEFRAVFL